MSETDELLQVIGRKLVPGNDPGGFREEVISALRSMGLDELLDLLPEMREALLTFHSGANGATVEKCQAPSCAMIRRLDAALAKLKGSR